MSVFRSKAVQKNWVRKEMSSAWHNIEWVPLKVELRSKDHDQVYLKAVVQMMDNAGENK